ncbi:acid-sensing ion channel 1-like [Haliotis rufescens]|uniref:acid-sensing ion channel 1-like n=1 Tax=Haliotis rufescens TaxID=6454 RepID=UPI00201F68DD|nr:acid-sensing ion channel 1-like [Haliotis rufescens]
MKVDIGLVDMAYTEVRQMEGYPWMSLIGDIGGTLGLCLGGSVLTLVEIVDVILTWVFFRDKDKCQLETELKAPDKGTDERTQCPL